MGNVTRHFIHKVEDGVLEENLPVEIAEEAIIFAYEIDTETDSSIDIDLCLITIAFIAVKRGHFTRTQFLRLNHFLNRFKKNVLRNSGSYG